MKFYKLLIPVVIVVATAIQAMDRNYARQLTVAATKNSPEGDQEFKDVLTGIPEGFRASDQDQRIQTGDLTRYLSNGRYVDQVHQLLQHRLLADSPEKILNTVLDLYIKGIGSSNAAIFQEVIDFLPEVPADVDNRRTPLRGLAVLAVEHGLFDVFYVTLGKRTADIVAGMPQATPRVARSTQWAALHWVNRLWNFIEAFHTLPESVRNNTSRTYSYYVRSLTFLVGHAESIDVEIAEKFFEYSLARGDNKSSVKKLFPLIVAVVEKLKASGVAYTLNPLISIPIQWYQYSPPEFFATLTGADFLSEQEVKRAFFVVLKREDVEKRTHIIKTLLAALPDNNELPESTKSIAYAPVKKDGTFDWRKERDVLASSFFDEILRALDGKGEELVALYLRKFPELATQTALIDQVAMTPLEYVKYMNTKMIVDLAAGILLTRLLIDPQGQFAQQMRQEFSARLPQQPVAQPNGPCENETQDVLNTLKNQIHKSASPGEQPDRNQGSVRGIGNVPLSIIGIGFVGAAVLGGIYYYCFAKSDEQDEEDTKEAQESMGGDETTT